MMIKRSGGNKTFRDFFTKKVVIVLSIIILLFVWDIYIDPPAWWRFKRQADKNVILNYVKKTYPDTIKRKGGKFPLQLPAGPFEHSVMYFELDGVNFSIYAQDGKVTSDTYYEAKAEKFIREKFIDDFVNERGISPDIKIDFLHHNHGGIRDNSLYDIYGFDGTIQIKITQERINGVFTPKEVGWFYDFYQYWMEKCDVPNCAVYLYYLQNNEYVTNLVDYRIWFKRDKKTFSGESDFYANFTT